MDKEAIRWLHRQLPKLVENQVIDSDTAGRIRAYYQVSNDSDKKTYGFTFGVIGITLVGLGIILILAHNWDQLTRLTRMLISLAMLLLAQVIAGYVVLKKADKNTWNEGAAIFLMLMVGAAMALIGQTYHLTEDTSAFLLTWMVLSFPLIYIMKSTAVAIGYLIGITVWVYTGYATAGRHLVWILLGLTGPYYWQLIKQNRYANTTVVFTWCFITCFLFSFGGVFEGQISKYGFLIFACLFSISYLIGKLWFDADCRGWRKPFKVIGLTTTVGLCFVLSFRNLWIRMAGLSIQANELMLAATVLIPVVCLLCLHIKKFGVRRSIFGCSSLVIGCGYLLNKVDPTGVSAIILLNILFVLMSLDVIVQGVRTHSLGVLNIGMLMFAVQILARFLDADFSFIVRGFVFVGLGVLFLLANWIAVRRRGGSCNGQ